MRHAERFAAAERPGHAMGHSCRRKMMQGYVFTVRGKEIKNFGKKRLTNRENLYRHFFTQQRRVAQVAEHFLDTEGVSSSSLLVPTTKMNR